MGEMAVSEKQAMCETPVEVLIKAFLIAKL